MPSEAGTAGLLWPQWDASPRVGALMSTRTGGISRPPWDSLNLGAAVGDDAAAVAENRRRFIALTGAQPLWLRQAHGCTVVRAGPALAGAEPPLADGAWTDEPGVACIVQVADCMPVLLAAPEGGAVAAAHAGWRGLAGGVVEAALSALCDAARCAPQQVSAWLGPCIGPRAFEVGSDVLQARSASCRARQRSARRAGGRTCRSWCATACSVPAWSASAAARGARSRTAHGSSRTVAMASPAGSPLPSGYAAEAACAMARRRARRRPGVPSTYSTIDSGSTP